MISERMEGEKMSKLKPLICPQCGGTINRSKRKCEYCGTQYDLGYDDVLHFEVLQPGTHVLGSQAIMTDEMIQVMGSKKASEYILRRMAEEMAEQLIPFMDVKTELDPVYPWAGTKIRARLRVIDPTFRF